MALLSYQKSLHRDCGLRPLTLKMAVFLVLFTIIGLPCVSPFGSEASISSSAQQRASKASKVPVLMSSTELALQTEPIENVKNRRQTRFQVLNIWNRLRRNTNMVIKGPENDWKNGELHAGLLSRLFYFYAEPLLDLSSERPLEVDDAFYTHEQRKMRALVPSMLAIYNRCRLSSRKRSEAYHSSSHEKLRGFNFKRRIKNRVDQSETITLATAIFIHQKDAFIRTGMLRFTNTMIQAFPAILISRLLRLIEHGEANHPSKALSTAISLILILSLKMIVENKYFYHVVKCATEIRGVLMGMIFDKSLRVSNFATPREKGVNSTMEKDTYGSGSVINLMQSDATVIETLALQVHTLWDGLLQVSSLIP